MAKLMVLFIGKVLSDSLIQTKISVFQPHHKALSKCLGIGYYRGFRGSECGDLEDFLGSKPIVIRSDSPFANFKLGSFDRVSLTGIGRFYQFEGGNKAEFGQFYDSFEDPEDPKELRSVYDEEGSLVQALLSIKDLSVVVFPDGRWSSDLSRQRTVEVNVLPQFAAYNVSCVTTTGGNDFFSLSFAFFGENGQEKEGKVVIARSKAVVETGDKFKVSIAALESESPSRRHEPSSPFDPFSLFSRNDEFSETVEASERAFFVQLENFRWRIFLRSVQRKCLPTSCLILEVYFHEDFGFDIRCRT